MSKKLDFNALEQPTLELTMKDEARTKIHVGIPAEDLIERLTAAAPDIKKAVKSKDGNLIRKTYELAADLISCNEECLQVSAEDLRGKYGLKLPDLIIFTSIYLDFIGEIQNAKN
jgi:hypothetical protein